MQSKNAEHTHHILPLRVYLGVGGALLFLTIITVAVAQFDFGEWNLIVAMAIASFKALLVAFFFMHLWYDNKIFFSVFVGSVLFLAIFITFTMLDTLRRGETNEIVRDPIDPKAVIYQPGYQSPAADGDSSGVHGATTSDSLAEASGHGADSSAAAVDSSQSGH